MGGNDSINSAFGADVVIGGSGGDAINGATAGPRARVSCGTGRDRVRLNNREKRRTTGCEVRYILRDRQALARRTGPRGGGMVSAMSRVMFGGRH